MRRDLATAGGAVRVPPSVIKQVALEEPVPAYRRGAALGGARPGPGPLFTAPLLSAVAPLGWRWPLPLPYKLVPGAPRRILSAGEGPLLSDVQGTGGAEAGAVGSHAGPGAGPPGISAARGTSARYFSAGSTSESGELGAAAGAAARATPLPRPSASEEEVLAWVVCCAQDWGEVAGTPGTPAATKAGGPRGEELERLEEGQVRAGPCEAAFLSAALACLGVSGGARAVTQAAHHHSGGSETEAWLTPAARDAALAVLRCGITQCPAAALLWPLYLHLCPDLSLTLSAGGAGMLFWEGSVARWCVAGSLTPAPAAGASVRAVLLPSLPPVPIPSSGHAEAQLHMDGLGRVPPSHAAFVALSQRQRTLQDTLWVLAKGVCALLPGPADGAGPGPGRGPRVEWARASAATDLALRMLCTVSSACQRPEQLQALRGWFPPPLDLSERKKGTGKRGTAPAHRWECWKPASLTLRCLEEGLAEFLDLRATLWLTLASLAGNAAVPAVSGGRREAQRRALCTDFQTGAWKHGATLFPVLACPCHWFVWFAQLPTPLPLPVSMETVTSHPSPFHSPPSEHRAGTGSGACRPQCVLGCRAADKGCVPAGERRPAPPRHSHGCAPGCGMGVAAWRGFGRCHDAEGPLLAPGRRDAVRSLHCLFTTPPPAGAPPDTAGVSEEAVSGVHAGARHQGT